MLTIDLASMNHLGNMHLSFRKLVAESHAPITNPKPELAFHTLQFKNIPARWEMLQVPLDRHLYPFLHRPVQSLELP